MSDGASGEPEPEQRASLVFEAWLVRAAQGTGEPFERLVEEHPELQKSLERMRRMNAILQEALHEAAPSDSRREEERSRTLGDYRIVREIARGAMGIVFEAEQISLRRRVALKVLPAQLTLNSRALARFQREAEISAKLNHRNIISIHQIGEVAGVHFIVMELVEGTSLDRVIERMRRESFESVRRRKVGDVVSIQGLDERPESALGAPPAEGKKGSSSAANKNFIETAVRLIIHVADALDHAHKAGVIHRDVKPSNILVRTDGTPVLTDFGLAREEGLPALSMTGDFAGTPHYVSPEQAMSGRMPVDHRADVFSLGATLYELLTLELPFPGGTIHEVLQKIITKQPRDPGKLNSALAPDLVTIVLKALEKDPDRRYSSAAALAEDLRAFIEYRPIQARRTPTAVRALRWLRREPLKAGVAAALAVGVPTLVYLAQDSLTLAARSSDLAKLDIERSFLELALGHHLKAEREFREYLEVDPDGLEGFAGLVLALLGQHRSGDALAELDALDARRGTPTGVSLRLRVDALRMEGRAGEATELEARLAQPATAVEEYVEALRLLRGASFESFSHAGAPEKADTDTPITSATPAMAMATMSESPDRDTLLEQKERAAKAVRLLKRAVRSNRSYEVTLARACWIAGDEEEARLVATSIERSTGDLSEWKDAPERRQADLALAWYCIGVAREVFDKTAAIEAFEEASRLDPDLVQARERTAVLLLEIDPDRGIAQLRQLKEDLPDLARTHANLAVACCAQGRFTEAVDNARRALEIEPDMVTALDTLGTALIQLEDFAGAREPLTRAVQLEPRGARLHNNLGWTLWRIGQVEEARQHLATAGELDPTSPLPPYNLGILDWSVKHYESAIALFQKAIARNDAHPSEDFPEDMAWMGIGDSHWELGEREKALEAFEEAFRQAPHSARHALNLGGRLHEMERHAEAIAPLEFALEHGAGDESAHRGLVVSLEKTKDFRGGLRASKRWTEAHPESAEAWNMRAWFQVDPAGDPSLRDPEDALPAAEEAVRLSNGEAPDILDTLTWALHWAGLEEEARANAQKALELARSDPRHAALVEPIEGSLSKLAELEASSAR